MDLPQSAGSNFRKRWGGPWDGRATPGTKVASDLAFPVAHGVTRADADALGSWWEDRRSIVQPSEFILGADNTVLASSYSDGPIGSIRDGEADNDVLEQIEEFGNVADVLGELGLVSVSSISARC